MAPGIGSDPLVTASDGVTLMQTWMQVALGAGHGAPSH
jgi:hypothetical protein